MSDSSSPRLQFNENEYARPNQRWICGWAAEGGACPLGPTKRGSCRSSFECAPYRQGETWICARTRASGGPCEEGPLPDGGCCRPIKRCQPKRSIMAKRGVLSFCVFAIALGAALTMIGSGGRTTVVSPGRLNPQHSTVVQSCADCHLAGDGDLSEWVDAAFDSNAAKQQSKLCLKCHKDLGELAMSPHSLPPTELAAITERIEAENASASDPFLLAAGKALMGGPADHHEGLACATCHSEHHGADFELVNTTNRQCQICHTSAFHSFGDGHPEFSDFPYERRSRLYFDHISHYGSHFTSANGSSGTRPSCADCHEPDVSGRYMLVRGFDQTCASCHAEQIEEDHDAGYALATIPGLDVETVNANKENGVDIGQWPELYPLHVEAGGELTPLMTLLMQPHQGFAETAPQLRGLDLCDLRDATPAQLQHVQNFVWAYKEMLYDVVQGGHSAVRQRLVAALAPQVSEDAIDQWVKLVPLEMLKNMQRRWLPKLIEEVEARRTKSQLPMFDEPPTRDPVKVVRDERMSGRTVTSGWYLRESDLSLRYRPTGHSDAFLKTSLDTGARFAAEVSQTASGAEAMRRMFASLSSPSAIGRCLKCHTADEAETGGVRVNWFSYRPSLTRRRFTVFKHSPHITLLHDEACFRCHQRPNKEPPLRSPFRTEFVDSDWRPCTDPRRFTSNFVTMKKSDCAQCHTDTDAGNRCLSCHNYHIRHR